MGRLPFGTHISPSQPQEEKTRLTMPPVWGPLKFTSQINGVHALYTVPLGTAAVTSRRPRVVLSLFFLRRNTRPLKKTDAYIHFIIL